MEQCSFIAASRVARGGHLLTGAMDEIAFAKPTRVGDILYIIAQVHATAWKSPLPAPASSQKQGRMWLAAWTCSLVHHGLGSTMLAWEAQAPSSLAACHAGLSVAWDRGKPPAGGQSWQPSARTMPEAASHRRPRSAGHSRVCHMSSHLRLTVDLV